MGDDLKRASELVGELKKLSKQAAPPYATLPRSGDEIAIDQIAVFGELLVELTRYMDRAQRTIKNLTVAIAGLTALLVAEAVALFLGLH